MNKIQKRKIIKSRFQKYCGCYWKSFYQDFNMILAAVRMYKEVNAEIIIKAESIEFKFERGGGRMPVDNLVANQLHYYLN